MIQEICERCTSPMQYTKIRDSEEVHKYGICDADYWLCLLCGNEVIITDQIKINDARYLKRRALNDECH